MRWHFLLRFQYLNHDPNSRQQHEKNAVEYLNLCLSPKHSNNDNCQSHFVCLLALRVQDLNDHLQAKAPDVAQPLWKNLALPYLMVLFLSLLFAIPQSLDSLKHEDLDI